MYTSEIAFKQIMQGVTTMCLSFFFNIMSSQITHTVWENSCRFMSCTRQTWDLVAALCIWFPSQWRLKAWRSSFFFFQKFITLLQGYCRQGALWSVLVYRHSYLYPTKTLNPLKPNKHADFFIYERLASQLSLNILKAVYYISIYASVCVLAPYCHQLLISVVAWNWGLL